MSKNRNSGKASPLTYSEQLEAQRYGIERANQGKPSGTHTLAHGWGLTKKSEAKDEFREKAFQKEKRRLAAVEHNRQLQKIRRNDK